MLRVFVFYGFVCPVAPNHWHLQAQILLVTLNLEPRCLLVLCRIFYCPICYEAQQPLWPANFRSLKKNKRNFTLELHCAIYTIDLFSVHTRCPPEIVCCFFFCVIFVFWSLLISAKRLWNFKTPYPFSKLGFLPGRQSLWNCWEKSAKRKKQLLNCACGRLYWKVTLGTQQCTLPLCVPQPHPTETETTVGLDGPGYLAQYQIRGVSPNAVDLRVFLAFGTVQTEETKTFINSKGFIIALMKSKSLQLQSNKSKKRSSKNIVNGKKCSFMYCIYSMEMCLALFLW